MVSAKFKKFLLLPLKVLVLLFVGILAFKQLPELRYDLGPKTPVVIGNPQGLKVKDFSNSTFVTIHGAADFEHAFTYHRYGLTFTYFTLKPYGLKIIVRTVDKVTDDWNQLNRFLGRLRPFAKQPFSYRIREIFYEKMDIAIPADSYFLALDDVPEPSGWQLGALVFSAILWIVLFYLFFIYQGGLKKK